MKFTARSYFNAAQEHLGMAVRLREQGEYFAAHYFAGIAVESILRALSVKEGAPFDSSHNIDFWAEKANLLPKGSDEKQDEFRAKLTELNLRWQANQRYCTAKMLDTHLYRNPRLDGRVRGDRVKVNRVKVNRVKVSSGRILELANEVVSLGVIR